MKRSEKIKAVVFDVGGVLALSRVVLKKRIRGHIIGIHEYIAKELNISLDQYFDSIDITYSLAMEGKISKNKSLQVISRNLKISKKKLEKLYVNSYKKHFLPNKQLFKKALELKKRGYKIAVLSDQWYLSREALMPKKLYNKFNLVLVSCEQGMRKPNPEFYKLLIKRLKLKPSQILFIDNQTWNIKPAKALGIKTILFKDNKSLFRNKKWGDLFH
ncbi:MAG: HAD-IA family hydrolase [Nanoarchaeota archaeon]